MERSSQSEVLVEIARSYIDFPPDRLIHSRTIQTAKPPRGSKGIPLNTAILCYSGGILKQDVWDLRKGTTLDNWNMALCSKEWRDSYGNERKCPYCEGEGCFFFQMSLERDGLIFRREDWQHCIESDNNRITYYQRRVKMSEMSEISRLGHEKDMLEAKERQIKQLERENQELREKIDHLIYMPGGIGARAAQEHFKSLL